MAVELRAFDTAEVEGSTDLVITKPTGTVDGDLMLCHISLNSASTPTTPTGWTLEQSDTTDVDNKSYLYSKTASSEGSTYNFGCNVGLVGSPGRGWISSWSGTPSIDVKSIRRNAASTTATGDTITPTTSPDSKLLFFVTAQDTGVLSQNASGYAVATSDPSWTELYDGFGDTGVGPAAVQGSLAYADRDFITATGSATATLAVSKANVVHLVSLRPASISVSADAMTTATAIPTPQESAVASITSDVMTTATAMPSSTVTQADPKYSNQDKNSATYTNPDKNSATWSNSDKSSGTWTNPDKS